MLPAMQPALLLILLSASAPPDTLEDQWSKSLAIADDRMRMIQKLEVIHTDLVHLCGWAKTGGATRLPSAKDLERAVAEWANDSPIWLDLKSIDEKLNHLHQEAESCKTDLLSARKKKFPRTR
jgi:hypothetical protein